MLSRGRNKKMTKEKGLHPTSPIHVHVDDTPVHVHVKKGKKKNALAKSASNMRLQKSTAASRARARSMSPPSKTGPWVPAPGKATRGGRVTWQGAGSKLEVNHLRSSDLSTDDEERAGHEVRKYEKKINNLLNEVGSLKNEYSMKETCRLHCVAHELKLVVLQKALKEIEHKDDLLNTSSRILERQEAELEHVEEELAATETENKLLRQNMHLISEEVEITKSQKDLLNYDREKLMKKLIEAEMDGQAASQQVRELKDLIRRLKDDFQMSTADQARLAKQKELFLETMADFEATNRTLRHLLRDQHRLEASGLRLSEQRDVLMRKLADSDISNERMRNQLLDCETLITELRNQLRAEKEERMALSNLQGSLENTRGHLQKQLRTKEADCNRMAVQIRSLEGHLAEEKLERERLQEIVGSSKDRTDRDKDALKKAARKIAELESLIERIEDTAKSQNESLTTRLHDKITENTNLRLENERIKNSVNILETKLRQSDEDIQQLRGTIKQYEKLVDEYKEQVLKDSFRWKPALVEILASRTRNEADESFVKLEEQSREKERIQREGEQELEKVKMRLHQRLEELEPLPEMLRATELRLHEANEQMMAYERRNAENVKVIAELTAKLEYHSGATEQYRNKCNDSMDSNRSLQSKYDSLERRLKDLEEQNAELHSNQTKLQDIIHQESLRLEEKTRENASLTRQLENALMDNRKQQEQYRDRFTSKERTYQSRIVDLETQLSELRAEHAKQKREKEENERKFNSRLYDLKDRLEQSHSTNRSMQNYVQFLKNSYSTVFGEPGASIPAPPSPIKHYP
ncbi:outer dense fiber protein 2-like isoform X5 [Physella acuta]|uniref:outer dense fiber protein 2-like isoform X5 n=1 Tax=Physella acuta TaxID=109671 RepID=UPI0027DE151F|nr:outer dense fiber protein 2-like isoform X5 [Physella acuta]